MLLSVQLCPLVWLQGGWEAYLMNKNQYIDLTNQQNPFEEKTSATADSTSILDSNDPVLSYSLTMLIVGLGSL